MTEQVLVPDLAEPWTPQTAFDRIVQWALVDKHPKCEAPADAEDGWDHGINQCRYRYKQDTGLLNACWAGCLIPDSEYNQDMERVNITEVLDWLSPSIFSAEYQWEAFLADLQEIHDESDPSEWPNMLWNFAIDYGLRPGPVIGLV